jgi:phosphate/sulfate permease
MIFWIGPAYFAGKIAAKKGHGFAGFFIITLIFPIIGLIIAAIVTPVTKNNTVASEENNRE